MAKILYEVKQNQNEHSAAYGKWYAQVKNLETLNTRKLTIPKRWGLTRGQGLCNSRRLSASLLTEGPVPM